MRIKLTEDEIASLYRDEPAKLAALMSRGDIKNLADVRKFLYGRLDELKEIERKRETATVKESLEMVIAGDTDRLSLYEMLPKPVMKSESLLTVIPTCDEVSYIIDDIAKRRAYLYKLREFSRKMEKLECFEGGMVEICGEVYELISDDVDFISTRLRDKAIELRELEKKCKEKTK